MNLFHLPSFHPLRPARLVWKFDGLEKLAVNQLAREAEDAIGTIDEHHQDNLAKNRADDLLEIDIPENEANKVEADKKDKHEKRENPNEKDSLKLELSEDLSEAQRKMRKEILDKIREQHSNEKSRKYNITLNGEWVENTLENRLEKQKEIWDGQGKLGEGRSYGASDIDHFKTQERHYSEKKFEREKRE